MTKTAPRVPSPIRVACITTTRADYGLLKWPMRALAAAPDFELCVIAGASHLAPQHGMTAGEIEADGFQIAERVECLLDTGSGSGVGLSAGLALSGIAQALARLAPDWVLILGDRYEILAAGLAAALQRIPICHLCGGDVTEGAYDDAFRHALSKLANLHCPTTAEAAARLARMGEEDWRIHLTGSPALDAIGHLPTTPRAEFFQKHGLAPQATNLVVTYHAETLAADHGKAGLTAMLEVLAGRQDTGVIVTAPNADTGGAEIAARLRQFTNTRPHTIWVESLGQTGYFDAMRHCDAMIGNSSSGLYEAPSFALPVVNIGQRQAGRLRADSVFDAAPETAAIATALDAALARGRAETVNPYGDGQAAPRILAALRAAEARRTDLLIKRFANPAETAS